jgi:Type I restriction enzyme R protein N terminus (HSDR_N)
MNADFTKPINIDELLLTKRLEPLSEVHAKTLKRIEQYDVSGFNEMEVRSYIIDPIVRILGYDKGTIFSADLEHRLTFLGRQLRKADYKFALWNENFWLIEAKKPQIKKAKFGYKDLAQGLEYSIHPTVNAALVVLCDGVKLEIFDREVSVDMPLLRVELRNVCAEFDKIRAILEPMQIWFFQKRRIIRMLDRVFDKEFNMYRVEEFSGLLERRLRTKGNTVIENFQKAALGPDDEQVRAARAASLEDLCEVYLFFETPIPVTNTVNRRLVELSMPSSFPTISRIFPDLPRTANDIYMAQAVTYLIALAEKRPTVEWLPAWLARGGQAGANLEPSIQYLLDQCLTYFEACEPYRLVLLAACAIHRILKIVAISNDAVQKLGAELHALARHTIPEISWAQILAFPADQLIQLIDVQTMAGLQDYVRRNSKAQQFLSESAKHQLKAMWEVEKRLLASIGNYAGLLKERSLREGRVIEWSSVTYDNLGHMTLTFLHRFPQWKDYLLKERRPLIENLACMGSHTAKEMLGVDARDNFGAVTDLELANRFFFGDVATLAALRSAYRGE